jgi:hypothetical protein
VKFISTLFGFIILRSLFSRGFCEQIADSLIGSFSIILNIVESVLFNKLLSFVDVVMVADAFIVLQDKSVDEVDHVIVIVHHAQGFRFHILKIIWFHDVVYGTEEFQIVNQFQIVNDIVLSYAVDVP